MPEDKMNNKMEIALAALRMIDALDPEDNIEGCSSYAIKGLVLRMGDIARQALNEIEPANDEAL